MATRKCRGCGNDVDVDGQGFSLCRVCKLWDAMECLHCKTKEDFPRPLNAATLHPKAMIYCDLCLHNAYFVTQNGMQSTCIICKTSWDRTGPAIHYDGMS